MFPPDVGKALAQQAQFPTLHGPPRLSATALSGVSPPPSQTSRSRGGWWARPALSLRPTGLAMPKRRKWCALFRQHGGHGCRMSSDAVPDLGTSAAVSRRRERTPTVQESAIDRAFDPSLVALRGQGYTPRQLEYLAGFLGRWPGAVRNRGPCSYRLISFRAWCNGAPPQVTGRARCLRWASSPVAWHLRELSSESSGIPLSTDARAACPRPIAFT